MGASSRKPAGRADPGERRNARTVTDDPNSVRTAPALPRRIALIDASPRDTDESISLILDDFAEAFEVYARLDADANTVVPQISRITWDNADAVDSHNLSAFDTIVLGFRTHGDNRPTHFTALLKSLASHQDLMPEARLYAIAATDLYEPKAALPSSDELEDLCARAGISWCGGLAVGASDMIPAVAHTPRMGFLRRRLSEATDDLILAIRCGTTAGVIEATPPIPRFVYQAMTNSRRHR